MPNYLRTYEILDSLNAWAVRVGESPSYRDYNR